MTNEEAAAKAIEALRVRDAELADGPLAIGALTLAREMDGTASLAMKSMAMREMRDTLIYLRELCPPEQAKDALDDLSSRRATRLARSAATSG